jgi:RNA polymerase sigma-70 factor (ECF subfamily)
MTSREGTERNPGRRLEVWAAVHRPRVWRTAYRILGDADQAEDVAQEVLLRLHRNPPTVDEARVGAWLHTVTINLCRDALRVRVRRKDTEPLDERTRRGGVDGAPPVAKRTDPALEVDRERAAGALRSALAQLPAQQEEAVRLRYIDGLSYREIAQRTGVAVGTVASRVFRGLQRLARELESRHLEILK